MTNIQIDSTHVKNPNSPLNDQVPTWTFYPIDSSTTEPSTETNTTTATNDSLNNILETYNFNNWNTPCQNWENMLDTLIPPTTNTNHNNNNNNINNHHSMDHHKTIMKNTPCSTISSSSSSTSSSSTSDHCMSLPPTPPLQSPTNHVFNIDFFTATTTPYVYTNSYKEVTPPPPHPSSTHHHLNSAIIKLEEMDLQPLIHPHQPINQSSSTTSSSCSSSTSSLSTNNNDNHHHHHHQFKMISTLDNNQNHHNNNNNNRRRASEHGPSNNLNHRQPRRRSTHPSVASVVSLTAHEPVSSIIDGIEHITFLYSHDRLVKEYTIRTDVDHVEIDIIPLTFRNQNTIYPRANVEKEEYTGNRWNYESSCNMLGWKLCWLNQQQLCGKRGLIQRAVDSYRNRHVEMRSRRVTRQEKVANGTLRKRRSKKSLS